MSTVPITRPGRHWVSRAVTGRDEAMTSSNDEASRLFALIASEPLEVDALQRHTERLQEIQQAKRAFAALPADVVRAALAQRREALGGGEKS